MNKLIAKVLPLVMAIIFAISLGNGFVFAALTSSDQEFIDYVGHNYEQFSSYLSEDTIPDSQFSVTVYGEDDQAIGTYYLKSNIDLKSFENVVNARYNMANTSATDKTLEITGGLSVNADTGNAVETLSGLTDIINIILGLMVVAVTLGMAVFTSFDVAYIAFPVFRNKCEDAKATGGSNAMVKTTSNGEAKLRWVTDEAQYAVQQSGVENGGRSAWGIYLKKRIVAYIFLAIILTMFMTGNINILTNIALNAVEGVMNVLSELA